MRPYITFNGTSSLDKGLRLIAAEPFIIPRRTRQREYVPGRLGSITQAAFELPALSIRLRLGVNGTDKADVIQKMHVCASWILSARRLTLWHSPNHYYTGAVEEEAAFAMLTKTTGQIDLDFVCDPPCRHKALVTGGFVPTDLIPIPEQISASNKTAEALNVTTEVTIDAGAVGGSFPPALYLSITGSWTTMSLGSLQVTEAGEDTVLYIDCEAQEVYRLVSGTRTNVKHTGDFPTLTDNKLTISGTDLNLSIARLLVIERG